jgi:hypothetical protein
MRSAVSSCAVSSHMYVVTGCSVFSVEESMYLGAAACLRVSAAAFGGVLHLCAGFFASMTREKA